MYSLHFKILVNKKSVIYERFKISAFMSLFTISLEIDLKGSTVCGFEGPNRDYLKWLSAKCPDTLP